MKHRVDVTRVPDGMAGTVPELSCIVPGKAKFVRNCMTNVCARGLPVFVAVWPLQENYRVLELKNKAQALFSSSRLELLEYSEQPYYLAPMPMPVVGSISYLTTRKCPFPFTLRSIIALCLCVVVMYLFSSVSYRLWVWENEERSAFASGSDAQSISVAVWSNNAATVASPSQTLYH